eukprot:TRINITY_DN2598_c0_g1_i2.p1 TRINITY_DN2598_c0_g1~~TRINITY_DN2598_c0_g1_i2.p1  ORF type:complete len:663 (+),score=91.23 TRINITY_DN2598_c0_g1_i2:52-2040(+)
MRTPTAVAATVAAGCGGWYLSTVATRDRMRAQLHHSYPRMPLSTNAYRSVHTNAWGQMGPIQCEDGSMIELWSPPPREEQMKRLEEETFDVLVIGGGATGAGIALDAATRGLKVAMVEREDFASGTSSRSTKLIHGGIRYLLLTFQTKMPVAFTDLFRNLTFDAANYQVVSSDLYERAYMIDSAPFMTRPLPMMIPMYKWWEVPLFWVGGKLYDAIAGGRRRVPSSHYMSKAEATYTFPTLRDEDIGGRSLKGCLVLYDGQMNDTRMNLSIALTASQYGAVITNHTAVAKLTSTSKHGEKDYKISGATVTDSVTGKTFDIKAKQVVNATGPFCDTVRKMADPDATDIIVPAQGAHVILPDYMSPDHMGFVRMTSDGRVLYFLPWEGSTIAGTTDHLTDVVALPKATDKEVEFILQEANAILNRPISKEGIRATWAGLRPLVKSGKEGDTKGIARDHVIDVVDGGLVTVCGGKWTTYRRMAEDGLNKVLQMNPEMKAQPCSTLDMQLIGSDRAGLVCSGDFGKVVVTLREKYDFSKDVSHHLVSNYGTRALQVAQIAQTLETTRTGLHPGEAARNYRKLYSKYPMLEAEVVFACKQEYARTIVDVLARRTRIAFLDADAAAASIPRVAELMAGELNWDNDETRRQTQHAYEFLHTMGLSEKPV